MFHRCFLNYGIDQPLFHSLEVVSRQSNPPLFSTFQRKHISLVLAVLLSIVPNIASGATLTYLLQPGSTITPYVEGNPAGPSEPLTGTFSWDLYDDTQPNNFLFDATALDFESASVHLTLDTTAANEFVSSVVISPQVTDFTEVVDATGLYISPLLMHSYGDSHGTYEGSAASPSSLTYPDLVLPPIVGGYYAARLNFTAILVPEPSALLLLSRTVQELGS